MTSLPRKMSLRAAERAMMTQTTLGTAYAAAAQVALRGAGIMMAANVPADMVVEYLASAGVSYRTADMVIEVREPKSNGLANPRGVWTPSTLPIAR